MVGGADPNQPSQWPNAPKVGVGRLEMPRSQPKIGTPMGQGYCDPSEQKPDVTLSVVIPASMAHYSDDIRRFVDAMIYKLEKNTHKGKWDKYSLDDAFVLMGKEIAELRAELGGNSVKIILEAADVANFAMMIANIASERGK